MSRFCRYYFFCSFQATSEEARVTQAETAMRFAILSIETNNLCIRGSRNPSNDLLHALKINYALPLSQRNIGEAEKLFDRALRYQSRSKVKQWGKLLIGLFLQLHRCCILVRKAQLNHQRELFHQALGHIDDAVICLTVFLTDSKEECDAVRPGTKQEESYCEALYLLGYVMYSTNSISQSY